VIVTCIAFGIIATLLGLPTYYYGAKTQDEGIQVAAALFLYVAVAMFSLVAVYSVER